MKQGLCWQYTNVKNGRWKESDTKIQTLEIKCHQGITKHAIKRRWEFNKI
jgi:hypothetical protein